MNVYVVTSGSYSDYHIRRVFISEDKARTYVKFNIDCEVEEHTASDEEIIEQIRYVDIQYTAHDSGWEEVQVDITVTNTLDHKPENTSGRDYIYREDNAAKTTLRLRRNVDNETDVYELEAHYLVVCRDLLSQIRSLVDAEGWTEEMVDEWLRGKAL